jgi:hypothetical protein
MLRLTTFDTSGVSYYKPFYQPHDPFIVEFISILRSEIPKCLGHSRRLKIFLHQAYKLIWEQLEPVLF